MLNSSSNTPLGFHGAVTSTIDWCESNYQFSYYIAEMANTLSNIVTIAFASYGCFLSITEYLPPRFILGYIGFGLIGIGASGSTLLSGFKPKLADELPMIYVTSTTLWLLFDHLSGFNFETTRTRVLSVVVVAFNVLFTWSYIFVLRNPVYHQVVFGILLFSVTFRIRYLLTRSSVAHRIPPEKKKAISRLFGLGVAQFTFAFFLWNCDTIFCDALTHWKVALGWPLAFLLEGHSWWHVFTASGVYWKFVGIEYLTLCVKDDQRKFMLDYKMGLPYVKRLNKKVD
ncbi:ceramidase [Mycena rebaudengoi]|nr:ceramidase [Mycena rebaudengoi]